MPAKTKSVAPIPKIAPDDFSVEFFPYTASNSANLPAITDKPATAPTSIIIVPRAESIRSGLGINASAVIAPANIAIAIARSFTAFTCIFVLRALVNLDIP